MPAPTRAPQSRPPGAPAYYLARTATWWLTALHQHSPHHRTHRAVAGPAGPAPARPAAAG